MKPTHTAKLGTEAVTFNIEDENNGWISAYNGDNGYAVSMAWLTDIKPIKQEVKFKFGDSVLVGVSELRNAKYVKYDAGRKSHWVLTDNGVLDHWHNCKLASSPEPEKHMWDFGGKLNGKPVVKESMITPTTEESSLLGRVEYWVVIKCFKEESAREVAKELNNNTDHYCMVKRATIDAEGNPNNVEGL